MVDQRKPSRYIYLPPDAVKRQAELIRNGVYDLLPDEILWRDRYTSLLERGYRLRPRYHPDWRPSWTGTNLNPEFCEDAVVSDNPDVLDAVRESDGLRVAMKAVKKEGQEIQISQFLSSLQHRTNHCVPIVDAFRDPLDPFRTIMVMEYLRLWDDPELATVGDAVDFVTQMLEGLAFLHNQRVAHRDIAPQNVMMDGRALYPQGHHPVWRNRSPDAIEDLVPLARMDHPVKYYYIDFGLSVRFSPDQSSLVVGDVGRDAEVPELSSTVPYDAFKADIYALGNLFDKELAQKYHRLEFLQRIVNSMKQRQPASRPTASQLVTMFQETRKTLDAAEFRWRLAPKSEPVYERFINDTVAVAKNSISQLRRFVRPE
ncbi:kinase-like protein [Trametes coccinea BRFM310]|uniref:Kinase-like protein n=1 Tax=Trametes coccinea (strain BRFM310) TaxID=1353009 RepID=A0A1Y2I8V4_TRAC3|nr:kinase-like protein [Trametes coccinea BRFM310]